MSLAEPLSLLLGLCYATGVGARHNIVCLALFVPVAVLTTLGGCGDSSPVELPPEASDVGGDSVRSAWLWRYRSVEVDADLLLSSVVTADGCSTAATLWLDSATSAEQLYRLDATPCTVLQLSAAGDIVLREAPTGYDWRRESLQVDTNSALLLLGPVSVDGVSYGFELLRRPCGDAPGCECALLRRRVDGVASDVELARRCG